MIDAVNVFSDSLHLFRQLFSFCGKNALVFRDGCFTLHAQSVDDLNPGNIPVIKNTTIIMITLDIRYKPLITIELERFIGKICLLACLFHRIHTLSPGVITGSNCRLYILTLAWIYHPCESHTRESDLNGNSCDYLQLINNSKIS